VQACQVSCFACRASSHSFCALCSPFGLALPLRSRQLLVVLYQWICENIPRHALAASSCPCALVDRFPCLIQESGHGPGPSRPTQLWALATSFVTEAVTGGLRLVTIDTERYGHSHRRSRFPPGCMQTPVSGNFLERLQAHNAPGQRTAGAWAAGVNLSGRRSGSHNATSLRRGDRVFCAASKM